MPLVWGMIFRARGVTTQSNQTAMAWHGMDGMDGWTKRGQAQLV